MTALAEPRSHAVTGLPDRPITLVEYRRLCADGVLAEGSPFELLEGWVTRKMPQGPDHRWTLFRLNRAVARALPPGFEVCAQMPAEGDANDAEPDLAVIRGGPDDYAGRHPRLGELPWVIEVSESSIYEDRGRKQRIYARFGIPIYWIVNLRDRQVEVMTSPTIGSDGEPGYAMRSDFASGQSVPVVLDGRQVGSIAVAELIPPIAEGGEP